MGVIALDGIDRPGLPALLAARGIVGAGLVFAADGRVAAGPNVAIEAADATSAAAALDAGAGEAVTRDDPDELVAARLAAWVKRVGAMRLQVGDLAIDPLERRVTRDGRELPLLPREYAMLVHFARSVGSTVTRPALRTAIWGRELDPGTNVIEVHVSRLRAKLHRGFAAPMLLTDKGLGYRLVPAIAGTGMPV